MDRCRLSGVELLNFVYSGTRDAVESYFRTDILGLTQCQLREECDALFTAGKSVRYVGANLVATLSKSICKHLNETNKTYNKPNIIEFEKVNNPFIFYTKKSYSGWKPLEGRYLNKGLSKTLMKARVNICSKIMDSVRDSCPEEIYPYIVDNLVKPCINRNIDPNLISRHSVVNSNQRRYL